MPDASIIGHRRSDPGRNASARPPDRTWHVGGRGVAGPCQIHGPPISTWVAMTLQAETLSRKELTR